MLIERQYLAACFRAIAHETGLGMEKTNTAPLQTWETGIGPHEGQELDLMLAGDKQLALFENLPGHFKKHLAEKRFLLKRLHIQALPIEAYIIYCPGCEQQAETLERLLLGSIGKGFNPATEREIGRILGYSERDIEAYIRHIQRSSSGRL